MNFVLLVYGDDAFKEFLLPIVENTYHEVILNKDIFCTQNNIDIKLEASDGKWRIIDNKKYRLEINNESYFNKYIKDQDVLRITTSKGENITVIVKETPSYFSVYKKFSLNDIYKITIGKSGDNTIIFNDVDIVSGHHAVIAQDDLGFILEDISTNGSFINYNKVKNRKRLSFGDCIDIFGLKIVFLGDRIAVNTKHLGVKVSQTLEEVNQSIEEQNDSIIFEKNNSSKHVFHRSPRYMESLVDKSIEIEAPPALKQDKKQPLAMMIGPSLTMSLPMLLGCGLAVFGSRMSSGKSSVYMYTGIITAVSCAVIAASWSLINLNYSKKKSREEELRRFEAYGEYLIGITEQIRQAYGKNTKILNERYLSSELCCEYDENNTRLWGRNVTHEDFLVHRLGRGDMPFQMDISVPKDKFTLTSDSLTQKPQFIKDNYSTLKMVPVCVDIMKSKLIGIIGGDDKRGAIEVCYSLVAQIATSNCYTDVKMIFIYDKDKEGINNNWEFVKWLPHVWSEHRNSRFVATNKLEASDIFYELTKTLRARKDSPKEKSYKPYYILFIESPEFLEGELINKYIFDTSIDLGISTILLANSYSELPNICTYVVQNDNEFQGVYDVTQKLEERTKIEFDIVSVTRLERLARTLANIEVSEIEIGGEIPSSLSFFELYNIKAPVELDILERWKKNRTYENMRAIIGQKAGGSICYLDVHEKYHGPHGLIAGTTGSGKSEMLQTYILSLAINFSPEDIGFFIIDYKGGGMANLFSKLPHLVGQISNLSGNQTRRAMVSIKSENKRRQRIFNEHGVNNINLYTRLYKNHEAKLPIPHLFIIIDEFAELKREEPDFMRELISVAQVGRSLGVHLILATQKPSGTVDDNIWSNSKSRLCLRVQDKQDSNDMLHKPDAAYITRTGRCYLQVGNDELYELFQSAYSGEIYDEGIGLDKLDIARMINITGKEAIVGSRAKRRQKEEKQIRWILRLLDIVNMVVKEMNESMDFIIENSLDEMITKIYKKFKAYGIEYASSDYNSQKLISLIHLFKSISLDEDINEKIVVKISEYAVLNNIKLPEMKEVTQLEATIEELGKVSRQGKYVNTVKLWLPVLPSQLYLTDLDRYKDILMDPNCWKKEHSRWSLEVFVGLCDDPVNQAQIPLRLDIAEVGHMAICGMVSTGKSTFLQSYIFAMIQSYTTSQINIYGIDYSSKMMTAFENAPHVGGIVCDNEEGRLEKLFNMLLQIIEDRKKLLMGGNYTQYVQAKGIVIPSIILIIDNLGDFRGKTQNKYDDNLVQISREGVAYGVFLVVTATGFGTMEIPSRIGDNIRKTISLEMNDKFQYADIMRTIKLPVLPEVGIKGRGLVEVGEQILEFHTALALEATDDYKRMEAIRSTCEKYKRDCKEKLARKIPEIPQKPVWKEFKNIEDVNKMIDSPDRMPLGYSLADASIYGINLMEVYSYIISGKARTGKSNVMKLFMLEANLKKSDIVIIDYQEEYIGFKDNLSNVEYITTDKGLYEYCFKLKDIFVDRNRVKNEWVKSGLEDPEIFEKMQAHKQIFIFISDFTEFIKRIYRHNEDVKDMTAFLSNITDKGYMHNVFWIIAYNQDNYTDILGKPVYENLVRNKKGIHLGGNVSSQRLFEFSYLPYMQQGKLQKVGIAMLPSVGEEDITQKVIVPIVKL